MSVSCDSQKASAAREASPSCLLDESFPDQPFVSLLLAAFLHFSTRADSLSVATKPAHNVFEMFAVHPGL